MKRSLLLLFLTGCMLGPHYETPVVTLPKEYRHHVDLQNWWEQFEDENLNSLITNALESNYDLNIACEKVLEARYVYRVKETDLWPKIDVNGQVLRERFSQNLFDSPFLGPPQQNLFAVGFDASWEVDLFGKNRRATQAAFADVQAYQEAYRDVYLTTIAEVATTYVDIRAAEELIETTKRNIEATRDIVDLAASRYHAGLTSEMELNEASSLLDQTTSFLPQYEENLKASQYALAVLLGQQPDEIVKQRGSIPSARGKVPIGLPSDLLRRRPDVRKAERELAAATYLIGSAKAELFPQFALNAKYGFSSSIAHKWFRAESRGWNYGPNISWPFIDFGKIRANINVKTSQQKQAFDTFEQAVLNALKDVQTTLVSYYEEESRHESLASQEAFDRENVDLKKEKYLAGLINFSEYLEAEKVYFQSQVMQLKSKQTLMTNLIALYKAMGGEFDAVICDKDADR